MTSPVTQDDIVSGAVAWLLTKPDITSALSMIPVDGKLVPGLFQYRPWSTVEGTGRTVCVVDHEGGWTTANHHNTMRFPRLSINIWADPMRDNGMRGSDFGENRRRAHKAFEAVDKHLHHVAGREMRWGSLRVISSVRLTEPTLINVSDGDGCIRLQSYYAVTQG